MEEQTSSERPTAADEQPQPLSSPQTYEGKKHDTPHDADDPKQSRLAERLYRFQRSVSTHPIIVSIIAIIGLVVWVTASVDAFREAGEWLHIIEPATADAPVVIAPRIRPLSMGDTVPVRLAVEGQIGRVELQPGDAFTVGWRAPNQTACEMTSPITSGISLSGFSSSIRSDHPWYPSENEPTVIAMYCINGLGIRSDAEPVQVALASQPLLGRRMSELSDMTKRLAKDSTPQTVATLFGESPRVGSLWEALCHRAVTGCIVGIRTISTQR